MQTFRYRSRNLFEPVQRIGRIARLAIVTLGCLIAAGPATAESTDWKPDRDIDGVDLESRPAASGFDEVRGSVKVCTDAATLHDFVGDPQRFEEWIPFTEEAWALPDDGNGERYYLRTETPWPMRSRDLIYRIERREPGDTDALQIDLIGEPDALPPQPGAVRMAGARGSWTLRPNSADVDVMLAMTIDPGRVPAIFANRRLAITVGQMLANLRDRFRCQ